MSRLHLNIGSNRGDRRAIIGRAVALIAKAFAPAGVLLSDYVESEPWGFDSPNRFLNRGVLVVTRRTLNPAEVLAATQNIEKTLAPQQAHRNPDGSYRDRSLDIDIIDLDGLSLDTDTLTLPHPRACRRSFVMEPLRQLDPTAYARLTQNISDTTASERSPSSGVWCSE